MSDALARLQAMLEASSAPAPAPAAPGSRELDPRLHGYQRRAVEHLHANPKAALMLEMGLGKTASVLQAITPDHLPVLVVAPKRVAENVWGTERAIWRPDLSLALAAGRPAKRTEALDSGSDIVVIGRDNLADVSPGQFRTVVLDESSGYKNRSTKRWKTAKKICDSATYVWELTGTPSPNGLLDLWAQIALLDGGDRLGRTLTAYRQKYFSIGRQLSTGVVTEWKLRSGADVRIQDAISDICLSMRSVDHLDLPEVTVNRVRVALPPASVKVYDQMVKTLVASIKDDQHVVAANAAVLTGKLSQITAGFLYGDLDEDTTELHDAKTEAVNEIVEGTGSPVLVFYRFKAEKEALLAGVPGAETVDAPDAIARWNRGEIPVMLAHPASAGHGLNLQRGGHTVVWTTLPWSLDEYSQANARVARQGQEHPVVVHHLIAPDTIDEAILARLHDKVSVQDALMQALRRES